MRSRIYNRLRWYKWLFWDGPNPYMMLDYDKQTLDIMIDRWLDSEPVEGRPKDCEDA